MNILYISSKKRWGGVTSWMDITAKGLKNKGHSVWILSHPNSKYNEIVNFPDSVISAKLGMNYNPITIVKIVFLIKKYNIDLLVTNIDKEVAIGGIAGRLCKIPNIRRIGREDDFSNKPRKIWNHKHLVDKSIVPCNYIRDKIIHKYSYLNKSDFTTIYNGRNISTFTDEDIFRLKNLWKVKKDEQIIGMTCQLLKIKYIEHLIQAFSTISDINPLWKLVITGEGPEKQNLLKLVKQLDLEKKVVFAGFSDTPLLNASAYDIGVLTSKLEGFPNSIVEYFSAGKPVIATNVGGNSEIVRDSVNGFLIPFGDIHILSEKLSLLINNLKLRNEMSKQATLTIETNFTEDKMIDELEKYFLKTIYTEDV